MPVGVALAVNYTRPHAVVQVRVNEMYGYTLIEVT
jgi:hypothetical protein